MVEGGNRAEEQRGPAAAGEKEADDQVHVNVDAAQVVADAVERPAEPRGGPSQRSEEHTSELQSRLHLVCRLLLEKKKKKRSTSSHANRIQSRRCDPSRRCLRS